MKDKLRVVDFETAKELKALGFDWETVHFYIDEKLLQKNTILQDIEETVVEWNEFFNNWNKANTLVDKLGNECFGCTNRYYSEAFSAPEQSLVIKWFRDVHKLGIEPGWIGNGYKAVILDVSKPGFLIVAGSDKFKLHPNFEDAELEGIKEAIKYLKNGTNL